MHGSLFSFRFVPIVLISLALLLCTSCGSFIASTDIKGSRHSLNEAVTVTAEEQLLLALVQTRFIHNPGFVDVSAINTQLQWSAGMDGSYRSNPSVVSIGPSLSYGEYPTITYIPLQGSEFVRRIMTPVNTEIVALMLETGWSSEVVLRLMVQRINNIPNGFDGSVMASNIVPRFRKFNRAARLINNLMARGDIVLTTLPNHHFPVTSWDWKNPDNFKDGTVIQNTWEASDNPVLFNVRRSARKKGGATERDLQELVHLLDLPIENLKVRNPLNPNFDSLVIQNLNRPGASGDIWIQTRSFQEILYALSWAVETPPEAVKNGEVPTVTDSDGRPFDWKKMYGDLLNVHFSFSRPKNAAIAVLYHGNWYYVAKNDIPSKKTFVLLAQMTKMLSGLGTGDSPALTLPVK
jgi:hypothetical protein